jgi:tRNA A-37 threonylcarbamoyl transferase component Bud32
MKKSAKYYNENPESKAVKARYDKKYNERTVDDRVERNRARREAVKDGRAKKGDGKDVDHVNGIKCKKTRVMSASANRAKK